MKETGGNWSCRKIESVIVDYVDGGLSAADAQRVESHCSECEDCADSLIALREVPAKLLAELEADLTPELLERDRSRIVATVEEIIASDRERNSGFDVRILLPVAAALVIALAGVLSLQQIGRGARGTMPARAALSFEIDDPIALAVVAEEVGVPIVLSEVLWEESGEVDLDVATDLVGGVYSVSDYEDLTDDEVFEVERLLGVGGLV